MFLSIYICEFQGERGRKQGVNKKKKKRNWLKRADVYKCLGKNAKLLLAPSWQTQNSKYATDGLYTENTHLINSASQRSFSINNAAGGPALPQWWDVKVGELKMDSCLWEVLFACSYSNLHVHKQWPYISSVFSSLLDQYCIRMWETMKFFSCWNSPIQSYQMHSRKSAENKPLLVFLYVTARHKCAFVYVCVCMFAQLKKQNVMCFGCDYKVRSWSNLSQAPEKPLIHNEVCCLIISFEEDLPQNRSSHWLIQNHWMCVKLWSF